MTISVPPSMCRLCREEKPLLKKSHIIPEFMYQALFDESHKLNKLTPSPYIQGERRVQRPPTGEYESNVLCLRCDSEVIGSYESYGRRVLYAKANESPDDPMPEHGVTEFGVPVSRFTNVDYAKFKLFLLSILWRASISSRSFFHEIQLGPYEEPIRKMILLGDPGRAEDYPIILLSWLMEDSVAHDFVAQPSKNRAEGGIRYVFIIAGMTYVFHVSPNSIEPKLMPFSIFPSGMFSVLYTPKGKGKQLFQSYFDI